MLKGFAITPPVVGRISIGRVIEKNGKRLPEKDDQFTITTQVQNQDGWMLHPAHDVQLKRSEGAKLRTIQVMLPFNDPDLNLRVAYTQFDRQKGWPTVISDGTTCQRRTAKGMETIACAATQDCCLRQTDTKPYGRLYVKIGDEDDLGVFIFRTTSYNSIRTLAARLRYYAAVSGGRLATLPLELKLRGKSTTQSYRTPIYYVDLVIRDGLTLRDAIQEARRADAERLEQGFDQAALDEAARLGFGNGSFEETEDDLPTVAEEFFPQESDAKPAAPAAALGTMPQTLGDKLKEKLVPA
ncbi:hydrolase or metal-binding protein [Castellaniella defragrans]|uniref:recombination directionality factor n=1 Tax=Castellaniella defragrans TaxID=75697 RepID=UPI002AFF384D|nr:hydrolase or metal-binding protein [Castellaniella defragrans]